MHVLVFETVLGHFTAQLPSQTTRWRHTDMCYIPHSAVTSINTERLPISSALSCISGVAGEEVTRSYTDGIGDDVASRRRRFRQQYNFSCKCPRCETEVALPQSIKTQILTLKQELDTKNCQSGSVEALYRQVMRSCIVLHKYDSRFLVGVERGVAWRDLPNAART